MLADVRTGLRGPLVMGIVNVTPDSFSDGGLHDSPAAAVAHAERLIVDGVDVLDIGGESTRPGSDPVPPTEQIRRVVPVIAALAGREVVLSVDTTSATVAEAALDAGAHVVNDVSAGRHDPALLPLVTRRKVPVVLMHMRGEPKTMQDDPRYEDVVAEVRVELAQRRAAALAAGVHPADIVLDPGIGFGKTLDHNLALLRNLAALHDLGCPLLVGASRKRFLGTLTTRTHAADAADAASDRDAATIATSLWAAEQGAALLRVHDVRGTVDALKVWSALRTHAPS